MLEMLLYGMGVLAFYNTVIFLLIAFATGNYSRDRVKTGSYGAAFLVVYIMLHGTAVVCKRIGQGLDMGLLMAGAMMHKKNPPPVSPFNPAPNAPPAAAQIAVDNVLAAVPRKRKPFPKPSDFGTEGFLTTTSSSPAVPAPTTEA